MSHWMPGSISATADVLEKNRLLYRAEDA